MNTADMNKANLLVRYLEVLQSGRKKPDKNGGTFSESLENIEDIKKVKSKLNKIFEL